MLCDNFLICVMKLNYLVILFLIACFASCIATKNKNYSFNQKYSAQQAVDDISLLKKILEANHPSLYWYTPKDSIDYFFHSTIRSIKDSLSEIQIKNKIASVISHIKCGHTSVRFSKQFLALADKHIFPQFPLSIKTWQDSMVVLARYNKADSILKRGTVITSINGRNNQQMLDEMFRYICTDGNANNYKSQALSGNFPAWYRNVYGVDSFYKITFIDSLQKQQTITIKHHNPATEPFTKSTDSTKHVKTTPPTAKQKKEAKLVSSRLLTITDSTSTAYMRLTTFSRGNLRSFFNSSFKTLSEKGTKNLIIDVRENGGGSIALSILLLQYLMDKKFKIGDTVVAQNRSFTYRNHIKGWLSYWFLSQVSSSLQEDGMYHNHYFETHFFSPKKRHHFKGNIYILQGGYTFSAATILTSFLKGQKNVTLIGEETGGGYYGNSAMHIPNIILPNTKLQVRLPIYRYVMDKTRPKGKGVMPDVIVLPSSKAIKDGIDLKLQKAYELIAENATKK